jgi:hypothetical protein
MVENKDGELAYSWTDADPATCPWRLSLQLVTSNGVDYGTLSIVREYYEQPILLDGHVFGASKLTTALADAFERAVKAMRDSDSQPEEALLRAKASPEMAPIFAKTIPILGRNGPNVAERSRRLADENHR